MPHCYRKAKFQSFSLPDDEADIALAVAIARYRYRDRVRVREPFTFQIQLTASKWQSQSPKFVKRIEKRGMLLLMLLCWRYSSVVVVVASVVAILLLLLLRKYLPSTFLYANFLGKFRADITRATHKE